MKRIGVLIATIIATIIACVLWHLLMAAIFETQDITTLMSGVGAFFIGTYFAEIYHLIMDESRH